MEFEDEGSRESLRLEFDGVHFLSQGSIVGLVEPHGLVPFFHPSMFSHLIDVQPNP